MLLFSVVMIVAATLASRAASINSEGTLADRQLWDAAWHVDVDAVKAALQHGANPNAATKTARPMTAIETVNFGAAHDAVKLVRAIEVAKILFAAGAKIGWTDREILFLPIASGNVEMVRLLLDNGASPIAPIEGFTPTELAIKYGQLAIYGVLIAQGGIPVDNKEAAQIALIEAATSSTEETISNMERAIQRGAQINGTDPNNKTALIEATREFSYGNSKTSIICWLLSQGPIPIKKAIVDSKISTGFHFTFIWVQVSMRYQVRGLTNLMLRKWPRRGLLACLTQARRYLAWTLRAGHLYTWLPSSIMFAQPKS